MWLVDYSQRSLLLDQSSPKIIVSNCADMSHHFEFNKQIYYYYYYNIINHLFGIYKSNEEKLIFQLFVLYTNYFSISYGKKFILHHAWDMNLQRKLFVTKFEFWEAFCQTIICVFTWYSRYWCQQCFICDFLFCLQKLYWWCCICHSKKISHFELFQ